MFFFVLDSGLEKISVSFRPTTATTATPTTSATPANTTQSAAATPAAPHRVQLADLQSILSGIGVPSSGGAASAGGEKTSRCDNDTTKVEKQRDCRGSESRGSVVWGKDHPDCPVCGHFPPHSTFAH